MTLAPPNYQILSTMIAPALFMTATGSLILSTNNRLARVMDRIRAVVAQIEKLMAPSAVIDPAVEMPELRRKYLSEELSNLRQRARQIRTASSLLYFAFSMFVSSSLAIGLDLLLPVGFAVVPTSLAIIGVVALFWVSINLFLEMRTAIQTVDDELAYLDEWNRERLQKTGPT